MILNSPYISGSLTVTNLSGSGVRYLMTSASGLLISQTADAAIKVTYTASSTAGQTVFPVTNGYSTGLIDVFLNGTKLSTSDYSDADGLNITLITGSDAGDLLEFVKYSPALGVTNNALRQLTTFTSSEGQTVYSASYTPGLLDVYYNGSRLTSTEYTANNGTFITLATGSIAGDVIDILTYSYQVGAFTGIGGGGVANQIAFYNTTSSISGSSNFTVSGNTLAITGSFSVFTGSAAEFQVNQTGVNLGNALTDSHVISGSVRINPNGLFVSGSGIVGIGTSSPASALDIYLPSVGTYFRGGSDNVARQLRIFSSTTTNAGDTHTFDAQSGTGNLIFQTTSTERMRINSSGTVAIGAAGRTWNTSYRALELGNGWGMMAHATNSDGYLASNTYYDNAWRVSAQASVKPSVIRLYDGFILQTGTTNSVGSTTTLTTTFEVTSNGNVGMPATYGFTTSNAANLYIDSGAGFLYRSTSSRKYKKDITDYTKGLAEVLQMRPVYYKGISESDGDKQYAGLIAEEIHDLGLTEFVQYAEDGTPDALAYQNMIALLTKALQEANAKITALEEKLERNNIQ